MLTNKVYLEGSLFAASFLLLTGLSAGPAHAIDSSRYNLLTEHVDATEIELPKETVKMKATVLTVDTRDEAACRSVLEQLKDSLGNEAELCVSDSAHPMLSVFRLEPKWGGDLQVENDFLGGRTKYRREVTVDADPNTRTALRDTPYFGLLGVGVFGVMVALPGESMNWNPDKGELIRNMPRNWKRNVQSSPVMDGDSWVINFVGHPVSGAASYGIARHAGVGILGSFGYSVMMSTFFWEYGLESMVERPSLQDLLITPVVGSIMGELFYQADRKIVENEGKIFGSKALGTTARIIVNPAGMAIEGMKGLFGEKVVDRIHPSFALEASTDSIFKSDSERWNSPQRGDYIGFRITFSWK